MPKKYVGVELARTGRFDASTGPITLTTEDFDNLQEAYEALKGKVDIPIKLGHDDEQAVLTESGLPAAGWVENVRREGQRLLADLVNVPEAVVKLIDSGALRKRSIEAVRNVTLAGKRWKFALTGLALLGAELPAVDSLEDITALYASGAVQAAADINDSEATIVVVKMAGAVDKKDDEEDPEALIDELRTMINRIAATTAGKRGAPKLRQLLSVAVDEMRRTSKLSQENDMDITKLRTMLSLPETATEDDVLAALAEKLKPADHKEEGSDETLATLNKELTKAQTRITQLENDKAKTDVTSKVDEAIKARRFMPAARENLVRLAMHDIEAFDELVKSTPENAVLAPEKGTTSSDGIPAELEPTEGEVKIAAALGLDRKALVASKAKAAGITVVEKKDA